MQSYEDVEVIPSNAQVNTGTCSIGVLGVDPGQPVSALLAVAFPGSAESAKHRLRLGETFPVGTETWYFAGVRFESASRYWVTVRRLAPGAAPPFVDESTSVTGWRPAQRQPYGQLDEAQLQSLEQALGRRLPGDYRHWLSQTNGMQPVQPQHVPGAPFTLFSQRPLLGVHPDYPPYDLVAADRQWRVGKLSEAYVVIALPMEGLLVVRVADPYADSVSFLPQDLLAGPGTPEAVAQRERQMIGVGQSIGHFLGSLTPLDPPPHP
ncbi:SMI1/KNR4 family protein [Solwaraspora sp. WMMD406]|uniref:DUF6406 domain-containing protein n=1 Tax=Solwaraspora sp. WMMD406 TaxID=3016095 RepID=UPI002417B371|nr:DUF6406 domain-containing protein [Solwaraspora sp. WMMD406]MDG4762743.1 SMI1/KNR4 family protein [Solwaraspora sp. WMMD406]